MGHLHENGIGVIADRDLALDYYRRSAELGYELGLDNLTRLEANATEAPALPSADKIKN